MERGNFSLSSSLAVNSTRSLLPVIGDADLLPDDLLIYFQMTLAMV